MDALKLLTADHNRVRGLFKRFKDAEEKDDSGTMAEVSPKILEELEVHTTIEEEIFYPTVRRGSEEIEDLVKEGIEEHAVAKNLVGELRGMEPGAETFAPKMKVLIESVEHHAEEEETEMWKEIRKSFDSQTLEELATKLEARKKELGAPTLDDKLDLTEEQLKSLAQEQEIPGRSKMSHEELAATVAPS